MFYGYTDVSCDEYSASGGDVVRVFSVFSVDIVSRESEKVFSRKPRFRDENYVDLLVCEKLT